MSNQRRKGNNKRRGDDPKLDEFPEEFDDTFFHNELVESNRQIPVLRHIVYRKIRDAVADRIVSYNNKSTTPLTDKFDVEFVTGDFSFSEFEWAVVREELMRVGIEPRSEFSSENKLSKLTVTIEREISLTETMKEMRLRDEDDESDTEDCTSSNPI
jgi:hypothetical protein